MRRVSTSMMAIAGFAALAAGRAGAQVSPSSSNQANTSIQAQNSPCPPASSTVSYTSDAHSSCSATAIPVTPAGSYTSSATADVLAGLSVKTSVSFDGDPGDIPVVVNANGNYYRYVTFGADVVSLDFTSSVTHNTQADPGNGAFTQFDASIDIGMLTPDNQFGDGLYTYVYTSGPAVTGTLNVADLEGATSFYYSVVAASQITIGTADPIAFDNTAIFDPVIVCHDATGAIIDCGLSYDPPGAVTGTPEPASLALMGTGLVGVAGFARRKRRGTTAA